MTTNPNRRSSFCKDPDHEEEADRSCLVCWFDMDSPVETEDDKRHQAWVGDVCRTLRNFQQAHKQMDAIRWRIEADLRDAADLEDWLVAGFTDPVIVRDLKRIDMKGPAEASFAIVLAFCDGRLRLSHEGGDPRKVFREVIDTKIVARRAAIMTKRGIY